MGYFLSRLSVHCTAVSLQRIFIAANVNPALLPMELGHFEVRRNQAKLFFRRNTQNVNG